MACTQANATSPEPAYWPPSLGSGWVSVFIDPVAVAPPGMLMLGIEVVSVGVDSADEEVAAAEVVVELAVLVGSSSLLSRKNSRTPTPASTTTTAAMIQGRALFFFGGWPYPPGP